VQGLVPDPVAHDAFGVALRACYEAGARPGVVLEIERDDELIGVEDAARYFTPIEDWPALERQAYEEFTGRVPGGHGTAMKNRMRVALLHDEMVELRPLAVCGADAAEVGFGRGGILLPAAGGAVSPMLTNI
jgi:hypothetical protein